MDQNLILVVAYGLLFGVVINIYLKRHKEKKQFITELKANQFEKLKNKSQLVDVRSKDQFEQERILGARNIPIGNLKSAESKLFKNKPVYLYCNTGRTAQKASRILVKQGYREIIVLKDNLSNYNGKKVKK